MAQQEASNTTMAAVATQRASAVPLPKYKPIVEHAALNGSDTTLSIFDPEKHLAFRPPSSIISMKDLGYPEDVGVSPVAVSQPFRLFSTEAVQQMRSEIFKPEVAENHSYRSNIAASQLRGYCPKYAPFAYDAWTNPKTLEIISKIAGIDLVPEMNYEIGNINFSVKSEEQTKNELDAIAKQKSYFADDEGIAGCPWEDDKPVVGWHTDSYPFVCVLMLSDCTNMVGGETALYTADGNILKVRGPEMGCAVVLQGRYITHQALRALGAKERITSVTSFRPRSPFVRDDTVLTTVRPISDLAELYGDFGEYRLEILEARIQAQLKKIRNMRRAGKKLNILEFKEFLKEQYNFLQHMDNEMVPEDEVTIGYVNEFDPTAEKVEEPEDGISREVLSQNTFNKPASDHED